MLNDSAPPQVTVNGKLVESTSTTKSEHQVFRYHVNILKPGQRPPQDYDREIHLCHTNQNLPREDKELNTSPRINNDDKFSQSPAARAIDELTVANNKDEPASPLVPEQPMDKPLPAKGRIKKTAFKIPVLNLTLVKQGLTNIKNAITTIPKRIFAQSFHLINHFSIPSLKISPPRNIFANTNRTHIGKAGLIGALILAVTLIAYFLPYKTQILAPFSKQIHPPSTSDSPAKAVNSTQDYHAVIKKNTDGITITIEGPEYAEVMTKLPPGYHPLVVGNKIVHVVTAGNTLWFIAKRYIKNPYRYPELVRLNKIKNPDLIYPGDRVIIQYIRKP